jgi:hypothetical protein
MLSPSSILVRVEVGEKYSLSNLHELDFVKCLISLAPMHFSPRSSPNAPIFTKHQI